MGASTLSFSLLVLSAAVLFALTVFSLSFRQVRSARLLVCTLFLAALWPGLSALEIAMPGLSGKLIYHHLRVVPVAFLPVFVTLVTLDTTRHMRWLTPVRAAVLCLVPAAASVIVLTGDTAGLLHAAHFLDPSGVSPFVHFTRGPGAWVLAAWSSLLLVGDMALLLLSARGASRVAWRQALLFTIGLICPVWGSIVVLFDPRGLNVYDFGALGVTVAGILTSAAFFRYRLFDLLPIVNTVLFDAIDDIALVFDVKGALVGFNGRAETEMGLSRRTSPGITHLPAPWDAVLEPKGDLGPRRTEALLRESGRAFDVAVSDLRLPRGNALGTLVVLHETTRRRQTEDELRYAKERLQIALDGANAGLWEWIRSDDGDEVYWSPHIFAMLGHPPNAFAPDMHSFVTLLHPDDRDSVIEAMVRMVREGAAPGPFELRIRTSGGGWFWGLCRCSVVELTSDGEARHVVGTLQDVTERRDAEAKLRGFIEQATESICLTDTEGRIVEFNRSAEELTGYPRSRVLGMHVWDVHALLLPPDVRLSVPTIEEMYREALLTGDAAPLNGSRPGRIRRADGAIRESDQVSFVIRTYKGTLIGCLAHDVTSTRHTEEALRKSEEQLRQAQKMEAIGRLAGGVAHDFNNILTIIAGYAEILREGQPKGSPILETIDSITRAAGRASTLTRQLLAFSRKQVMESRVFCTADLLRAVEAMLARVIGEDVNLSILAPPGLWAIRADPSQVEQVLMNLAVNSRDAMPDGGTLAIATSNTTLDAAFVAAHPMVSAGDYVRIDVTDSGHGMDAQTMARIFEPFFTTKAPGKGTGLGLSMAYGIVKQSGGHIFCESSVGRGTTFTMYFPRVNERPESIALLAPTASRGKGSGSVLLVEDEAGVRGFVRTVLERGGYRVEEAADGQEALDLFTRGGASFSHLVTDVVMPRMSGPDLVTQVRKLTPSIKVLYMSGYTDTAIRQDDPAGLTVAFLSKPFNPGDLLAKLREMEAGPSRGK